MKIKASELWWSDNHPITNLELAKKYFPKLHYSEINANHIGYMYKKEVK